MLKIVTDSTCCLTQAEAEELGVIVLPMQYVVDGVRHDGEASRGRMATTRSFSPMRKKLLLSPYTLLILLKYSVSCSTSMMMCFA